MTPLYEALGEVHNEYGKANRAAKDMVDMYKEATTATDMLNAQCTASQAKNQRLSEQVRQTEELLKKTREEMLQQETRRLVESEQEWQQIFQQAEDALKQTEARAVLLENRAKALEDQQHLAQTKFGNQLTEKEDMIRRLRRQSVHQQDEVRHGAEQIEELEEYVKIQESYFADQLVTKEMQLTELTEKHRQEQEEWTSAKTALEQRCSTMEVFSEQRRLKLLVVQVKLMQAEGATKA